MGIQHPHKYGELHYPPEAIDTPGLQPGSLLGYDEIGQRYCVEQVFLESVQDFNRTVVILRYATVHDVERAGGK